MIQNRVAPWAWAIFAAVVLAMLALDLGLLSADRRREAERGSASKAPSVRSAAWWSVAWVSVGVLFSVVVLMLFGRGAVLVFAAVIPWALTGAAVIVPAWWLFRRWWREKLVTVDVRKTR